MDSLDVAAQVGEQYARQLSKNSRTLGSPIRVSFEELALTAQRELKRHNVGVIRVGNQFDVDEAVKREFVRALLKAGPEADFYVPELERPIRGLARIEKVDQAVDALRIREEEELAESRRRHTLSWLSARRARHTGQGDELRKAPRALSPPLAQPELAQLADTPDISEIRNGDSLVKATSLGAAASQSMLRLAQGM